MGRKNKHIKRWGIRIGVLLLLVAVAVLAMWQVPWQMKVAENRKEPLVLSDKFTMTAAPGAHKSDANTMGSFVQSIEYFTKNNISGVVEADVRFLSDGTPVLSTDAVSGSGEGLVTVDELMGLISATPNLRVALFLREKTNLPAIHALADKHNLLGRLYYTGVVADEVAHVRDVGGGIPYYIDIELTAFQALDGASLQTLVDAIVQQGGMGIRTNWKEVTSSLVLSMNENGLQVSLTGVDKEDVMQVALTFAPNDISTLRPDVLLGVIQEREALAGGIWEAPVTSQSEVPVSSDPSSHDEDESGSESSMSESKTGSESAS